MEDRQVSCGFCRCRSQMQWITHGHSRWAWHGHSKISTYNQKIRRKEKAKTNKWAKKLTCLFSRCCWRRKDERPGSLLELRVRAQQVNTCTIQAWNWKFEDAKCSCAKSWTYMNQSFVPILDTLLANAFIFIGTNIHYFKFCIFSSTITLLVSSSEFHALLYWQLTIFLMCIYTLRIFPSHTLCFCL